MCRKSLIILLIVILGLGTTATAQDKPNAVLWETYSNGQKDLALEQALDGLVDNPTDLDLNHLAGRCLVDLSRPDEGRPFLELVVNAPERDWRYAWSLNYLGNIAWMAGDDEAAALAWTEVRDTRITRNVARNAANNLRFFALDQNFDDWTRIRTEHCIFAFSAKYTDRDREAFAAEHEQAYLELTAFFGGEPEWPVRYIVWGSEDEARELCGIESLGFARPSLCTVHCHWDQTVGHELTHVVSFQALQPQERVALINEGLAVLFDLSGRDRLATARAAVQRAGLNELDLFSWWEDAEQAEQAVLYPVAGAWMQTLLDNGGREKFFALCRRQTLPRAREIYGEDLETWLAEFTQAVLAES